jgi:hypothetical protein
VASRGAASGSYRRSRALSRSSRCRRARARPGSRSSRRTRACARPRRGALPRGGRGSRTDATTGQSDGSGSAGSCRAAKPIPTWRHLRRDDDLASKGTHTAAPRRWARDAGHPSVHLLPGLTLHIGQQPEYDGPHRLVLLQVDQEFAEGPSPGTQNSPAPTTIAA